MTKLQVSPELALPPDTVTSTLVVYGGKGMGKTNFGSVLVEELTKARLRWCALDPMGVWYGLRHSADGKGPGIEHVVLGGPHADLPILPTGGAVVADFVVDETVNVVIDFSRKPSGEMWSIGEKVRFVTDYALRLFQRQGELVDGRRRPPLLQVLDEAARYVPQIIPSGNPELARSVGAWEQLAEEGRNVGLGVAFLTQRSARLNKSVAELADAMLAFRTVGPNSLGAVMDWLGEDVERKHISELAAQVRALEVGQALVVSPGWLRFEGVVRIRARETFDSSRTIGAGDRGPRIHGKGAQPPDLEKYRARMSETIEKAKSEDPKALRARIRELEQQVKTASMRSASKSQPVEKPVEIPVLKSGEANRLAVAASKLETLTTRLEKVAQETLAAAHAVHAPAVQVIGGLERVVQRQAASDVHPARAGAAKATDPAPTAPPRREAPRGQLAGAREAARPVAAGARTTEGISAPQQRILDGLAMLEAIGIRAAGKVQLALFAKASPTSSSYANNLGTLRTSGLIAYPGPSLVQLTHEGRASARADDAPSTTDELHAYVQELVSTPQWRIIRALIEGYPNALTKDELAERAEASATSSSFANNLGALRSLGLIDYPAPGQVAATGVLVLEGPR